MPRLLAADAQRSDDPDIQSQWVSYDRLYQLFQQHAPLHVWQKGPGNLKQLIIEWYQGDPGFTGLAPSAWCKQRVTRKKSTCYFSFEYRPNGRRLDEPTAI